MKYTILGKTKLKVSRLCFGTQRMKKNDTALLVKAYSLGVNFWDTADCYKSQKLVGRALKKVGRENIIVMTKIDYHSELGATRLINKALKDMQTDHIDIVLLHGVDSLEDLKLRQPAFNKLLELKKQSIINHVGFSSHVPKVIKTASEKVEVILAPIHEKHIKEKGTKQEMLSVLRASKKKNNKGVIVMKILGKGAHVHQFRQRMDFAIKQKYIDSLNLGISDTSQLVRDVNFINKH